jgi:tetratricopeptide (TPR) repeat protein
MVEGLQRRRTVFLVIVLGVVPFFTAVNSLVGAARTRREEIAAEWASRGGRDLAAGRADRAAEDYRSARGYARDPDAYRRELAGALLAGHHLNEARGQLLVLWAEAPGEGDINLALARIAAREHDTSDAVRYYHAAIDGAWEADAAAVRRDARIELATFLLDSGDRTKAQAELIALSDDLPPDAAVITRTAALLLRAGATERALAVAQRALELRPDDPDAQQVAGDAAFALGDYRAAERHLDAAAARHPLDAAHQHRRELSARVLVVDPFATRIGSRERIRRVVGAFHLAAAALDRCPAGAHADLRDRVEEASPKITERLLLRDPDAVDAALALVSDTEAAVSSGCGAPTDDEAALRLALRQHRS